MGRRPMPEVMSVPQASAGQQQAGFGSSMLASLVLVVVALATHSVSLLADRVLDNVDLRTHFQWAAQVHQAMGDGVWYPRWMPLANGGLGEPSFVIMHPGWYWLVAGLQTLGLDTWWAMRVAAFASTLVLGLAVHAVLRPRMPAGLALASAVLVQTMPFAGFLFGFHAALPWHFSLAAMGLVMLCSVVDDGHRPGPGLAAAVAWLCLTHLLVTFMTLVCIGAIRVLEAVVRGRSAPLLRWLGAVALGLACATVYWLLAATSKPLFVPGAPGDELYLNWRNSFIWPVVTSRLFGTRWAVVQWALPLAPVAAMLVGAWLLRCTPPALRDASWTAAVRLVAVAGLALLLASELAYPAYASLGFLANVQWPYRFLTVASLAALLALAFAMAPHWLPGRRRGLFVAWASAAALSVLLAAGLLVKQYREGTETGMSAATLAGLFGQPGALPAGVGPDWRDYLRDGGLATECRRAGWQCSQGHNGAQEADFQLTGSTPARLRLPRFDFPSWRVELDGHPVVAQRDLATGLIAIELLPGNHRVAVRWSPLWQERLGLPVSFVALLALLAWAVWRVRAGAVVTRSVV